MTPKTMISRGAGAGLLVLIALLGRAAAAQSPEPPIGHDTVSAVADSSFSSGSFHRFLFGNEYRRVWHTPVRAPVLDLATYDGGLTPEKKGGGEQTKSLRFTSANGRSWVFRTVKKDARVILPKQMRTGFVADLVNDALSHSNPGGALTVPPMLDAIGVFHATPRLAVMPDDPKLGEFRKEFAGALGILEEFPDDGPHGAPGFAGSTKIINSVDLLHAISGDPDEQVDAPKFLTARLFDLLINDWDRHKDQWKWARFDRGDGHIWEPIPRDRDQAYIWFDGFFPSLARIGAPKLIGFDAKYPNIEGLTLNGRELDLGLLNHLEWSTWDSIATFIRTHITDSVIDSAMRRMPLEYQQATAGRIARVLKARRDGLNAEARKFYLLLARYVDIHATDKRDVALIDRDTSGVRVRLFDGRHADGEPIDSRTPYFDRRFLPDETAEIRVYLHGGGDSVLVRGHVDHSIKVRVIGGKGDNVMIDSSVVALDHRATHFYDVGAGPHDLTYGPDTLFSRRPQIVHGHDTLPPPPDFGAKMGPVLRVRYLTDIGFLFGTGMTGTHYAFRTWPYWYQVGVRFEHGTGPDATRFQARGDIYREHSTAHIVLLAEGSGLNLVRYYGLGNETARPDSGRAGQVDQSQYRFEPSIAIPFGRGEFRVGPMIQYTRTAADSLTVATRLQPYGSGDFVEAGLRAYASYDTRDNPGAPRHGIRAFAGASLVPSFWDVTETFGEVHGEVATFLGVDMPLQPVLALRLGGKKVWGQFPFFESAFLGGFQDLRGYDQQRFAGSAAAWGNAELRLRLGTIKLLIPGNFGIHGMADAGRVWAPGEISSKLHSAFGGGFWFNIQGPITTMSLTVAHSDERRTAFYALAGFGF